MLLPRVTLITKPPAPIQNISNSYFNGANTHRNSNSPAGLANTALEGTLMLKFKRVCYWGEGTSFTISVKRLYMYRTKEVHIHIFTFIYIHIYIHIYIQIYLCTSRGLWAFSARERLGVGWKLIR